MKIEINNSLSDAVLMKGHDRNRFEIIYQLINAKIMGIYYLLKFSIDDLKSEKWCWRLSIQW